MKRNCFFILLLLLSFIETSNAQFQEGEIKKRKQNMALVNISSNTEIKQGEELVIFRNIDNEKKMIGKGKVTKITKDQAQVKILNESRKYKIRRGDWVTSPSNIQNYESLLEPFNTTQYFYKIKVGYCETPLIELNKDLVRTIMNFSKSNYELNGRKFLTGTNSFTFEAGRRIWNSIKGSVTINYLENNTNINGRNPNWSFKIDKKIQNANFQINALYYYENFFQKFSFYAGAGAGFSSVSYRTGIFFENLEHTDNIVKATSKIRGIRVTEQIFFGAEILLSKSIGITLEGQNHYRKMMFLKSKCEGDNYETTPANAWSKPNIQFIDLTGRTIMIGLVYYH